MSDGKLTTEYIHKVFLDPKRGAVKTTEIYDELAEKYNEIVRGFQYKAPRRVVETLASLIGDRNRAGMKIMDLGCGTGLVGEALYAAGFTQLDGVDPSQGMLDVARSKGIYGELVCAYVGVGNEKLSFPDNSYDALTIAGSMGVNMMPCEGIYEMHRLVKPGGYIINIVRQETVNDIEGFKDRLEPMMSEMEKDGKWKLVSRVLFPDYLVDQGGVIFTHQWGVDGTVASESALRSAGNLLSQVRAPPPAPWPDGGPESQRSPCCGLAIYNKPNQTTEEQQFKRPVGNNDCVVVWSFVRSSVYY
ncbi:Williams-Beuren syndrome chromosomal region 27 protein [Plakobranchus ocellatus]|uniref:Williams-Beuren syndrome chromosomal region 27 protein n=1 Tax=Plakobranchus ocellatus TaxID=259542 RepID=A0AAV4BJS2_9GAST|nr:Williams-Beuren syndrome chromosomal region 27 protein [Plakobranchus ocellatus]